MEQEGPSFWSDIKKYEDTLARDPNSYCFAPLSELYRKVGMLDDAINVAKRGCEIHPDYVGGHMALGRAYFEKGLRDESRTALEKVARVTPDNLLAQRILSQIYIDAGEMAAAEKSLRIILSQNPDDLESKILLNSLANITAEISPRSVEEELPAGEKDGMETGEGDDALFPGDETEEPIDLEDAEILEEPVDEEDGEDEFIYPDQADNGDTNFFIGRGREGEDPLNTATLAELYVSQGFLKRALTIYRELLEADPANIKLKRRLVELKQEIDKDDAIAREHSLEPDTFAAEEVEPAEAPFADFELIRPGTDLLSSVPEPVPEPDADVAVTDGYTLDLDLPGEKTEEPVAARFAADFAPLGTKGELSFVSEQESDEPSAGEYEFAFDTAGAEAGEPAEALFATDLSSMEPAGGFSVAADLTSGERSLAGTEENVINTMERWLENIRRGR